MLKPIGNTVLIKQNDNEYVDNNPEVARILKEGILVAPDHNTLTKSSNTGTVIRTGSECNYGYDGKKVIFSRFRGVPYYDEGVKYRLLREHELLAVIDD